MVIMTMPRRHDTRTCGLRRHWRWYSPRDLPCRTASGPTPRVSARGRMNEGRPSEFAADTAERTGVAKSTINRAILVCA